MAVGLAATGELSYNGINFDAASRISVVTENVRDDADLTTIYTRIVITVATVLQSNAGTDNNMFVVRSALSEDGRALVFRNKGFGNDIVVSPAGPVRDIRKGPKPQVLEWRPIGASNACEIVWSVEVCIAQCESPGRTRQQGLSAFNYEVDFDINEHGDTTRTIVGYIEVVQTRSGRGLTDSADRYRELLQSTPPLGFKRQQRFHLSSDKSRLDFAITDIQIPSPNPYPDKVTDITGTHIVNVSRSQGGFQMRRNVIAVNVNMRRGISGKEAWLIFLKIVQGRILAAKQNGSDIFLDEVTIEEELFGRRCSFTVGYRTLGELKDMVRQSGLWEPLPSEFTWTKWQRGMKEETSVRGTQKLFHNPAGDIIVDLCGAVPSPTVTVNVEPQKKPGRFPTILRNNVPSPDKSYLQYQSYAVPMRQRPVVRQSPLQTPENTSGAQLMPIPQSDGRVNPVTGSFDYGPGGGTADVIQERGAGRFAIRLIGTALRAAYEIPRPTLVKAGNYEMVEKDSAFVLNQAGLFFGVPVYRASWNILYLASGSPSRFSPPVSPDEFPYRPGEFTT